MLNPKLNPNIKAGELHVWRVPLDTRNRVTMPPPTAEERLSASRFQTETLRRRYLRAHAALRSILGKVVTGPRLDFALHEKGKPYLPQAPEIQFNLSRSRDMALVAVALNVPVGVDIERVRPLAEHAAIARRYFPPGESEPANARDFFRRWTRLEAVLKAQGLGLYGAGAALEGEWMVWEIDAGPKFAAAVAAGKGLAVVVHDYGDTE